MISLHDRRSWWFVKPAVGAAKPEPAPYVPLGFTIVDLERTGLDCSVADLLFRKHRSFALDAAILGKEIWAKVQATHPLQSPNKAIGAKLQQELKAAIKAAKHPSGVVAAARFLLRERLAYEKYRQEEQDQIVPQKPEKIPQRRLAPNRTTFGTGIRTLQKMGSLSHKTACRLQSEIGAYAPSAIKLANHLWTKTRETFASPDASDDLFATVLMAKVHEVQKAGRHVDQVMKGVHLIFKDRLDCPIHNKTKQRRKARNRTARPNEPDTTTAQGEVEEPQNSQQGQHHPPTNREPSMQAQMNSLR
jgi:hypothetical protein